MKGTLFRHEEPGAPVSETQGRRRPSSRSSVVGGATGAARFRRNGEGVNAAVLCNAWLLGDRRAGHHVGGRCSAGRRQRQRRRRRRRRRVRRWCSRGWDRWRCGRGCRRRGCGQQWSIRRCGRGRRRWSGGRRRGWGRQDVGRNPQRRWRYGRSRKPVGAHRKTGPVAVGARTAWLAAFASPRDPVSPECRRRRGGRNGTRAGPGRCRPSPCCHRT